MGDEGRKNTQENLEESQVVRRRGQRGRKTKGKQHQEAEAPSLLGPSISRTSTNPFIPFISW